MIDSLKKGIYLVFLLVVTSGYSQSVQNSFQVQTGFNRIGFYNELGFKFDIKRNQFKLGLRHYTLDNFFEKNTIGFSFDYSYLLPSKNEKYFFYPGISSSFFMENKSTAQVFISDFKLINGVGINLNKKWSLFYQLGFGVVTTKSYLINSSDVTNTAYFNYELALGVVYHLNKKTD